MKPEKVALFVAIGVLAYMAYTQKDAAADRLTTLQDSFTAYDNDFRKAAIKYSIPDWRILKAFSWNESSIGRAPSVVRGIHNPSDRNSSASDDGLSWGIMQMTEATASWLAPGTTYVELNNPQISIDLGAKYIAWLLKRYDGDLEKTVMAYNEGPGNVEKGKRVDEYLQRFQSHYALILERQPKSPEEGF
jgi:membrane-bound lytic murein transglycosylase MltF